MNVQGLYRFGHTPSMVVELWRAELTSHRWQHSGEWAMHIRQGQHSGVDTGGRDVGEPALSGRTDSTTSLAVQGMEVMPSCVLALHHQSHSRRLVMRPGTEPCLGNTVQLALVEGA